MYKYFLFNKPYRVLSQFSKEGDKKTLADFFPDVPKNIYPVGRLDYDSEGLLLLTDDKSLTSRLLEPSFEHPRTYLVQVDGAITGAAVEKLEKGVSINIEGKIYHTKKAKGKIIQPPAIIKERNPPVRFRKNIPTSWISLTLTEGKNRQVRKMTAAVGYPTLRLIRYSIGNIKLDGIEEGKYVTFGDEIKEIMFNMK